MEKREKGEQLLSVLKEIREEKGESLADEKVCPKCGRSLPATKEYYYTDKKTSTGLACWCKDCHRAKQKVYGAKMRGTTVKKDCAAEPGTKVKPVVRIGKNPVKVVSAGNVSLDFAGHTKLLEDLVFEAADEFRSLDQQILWICRAYFNEFPVERSEE